MGKYQLNEKPPYCVVPTIELIAGNKGTIDMVAIYLDSSVIFRSRWAMGQHVFGTGHKLSDIDDSLLQIFSDLCEYPLDELTAIRRLEREYRTRQSQA